jgi:hypothetical protein
MIFSTIKPDVFLPLESFNFSKLVNGIYSGQWFARKPKDLGKGKMKKGYRTKTTEKIT